MGQKAACVNGNCPNDCAHNQTQKPVDPTVRGNPRVRKALFLSSRRRN